MTGQATSRNHPYPRRRGGAAADPWVGWGAGCHGARKGRQGPVRAQFRAAGRPLDRLGLLRVGIRAEDHRGARVGQHRHQRRHRRASATARSRTSCAACAASTSPTTATTAISACAASPGPGDYNARILLLVDGHRLNDNVFGSALLGTEFALDLDIIERIEIIRGPSSSLYGTSAFFAVINVITKKGGGHRRLRCRRQPGQLRHAAAAASASARDSPTARRCCSRDPPTRVTASMSSTSRSSTRPRPTSAWPATSTATGPRTSSASFAPAASRWRRCTGHATRPFRPRRSAPSSTIRERGTVETQQFVDAQYDAHLGEPLARWRAGLLRPLRLRRRLPLSGRRRGRRAGLRAEPRLRPRQPVGRRGDAAEAGGRSATRLAVGLGVSPTTSGRISTTTTSIPTTSTSTIGAARRTGRSTSRTR